MGMDNIHLPLFYQLDKSTKRSQVADRASTHDKDRNIDRLEHISHPSPMGKGTDNDIEFFPIALLNQIIYHHLSSFTGQTVNEMENCYFFLFIHFRTSHREFIDTTICLYLGLN